MIDYFINVYYFFYRFFKWELPYIPKKIKWFVQRGLRGWADCDTWCFDEYLAKIISKGTMHLSNNLHGFPPDLTEKEWIVTLRKISKIYNKYLFIINYLTYDKYIKKFGNVKGRELYMKRYNKIIDDMKMFIKWFGNLVD